MKSNLITLIVFLLSVFLLLEISIRLLPYNFYPIEMTRYALELKIPSENRKIGHVHRPYSKASLMDVDIQINSLGFRDKEYRAQKSTGVKRHIFLGDSITFAWGVSKEDSFEHLLEIAFNQTRQTEVINFGTGNYNTEQQVNLFFEKGFNLNPDQVVLFYFINDAEITPVRSRAWFLGYSQALTLIRYHLNILGLRLGVSKDFIQYYSDLYREDSLGWDRAQGALVELKKACGENQIKLKVVILPELHDLENYPFVEQHKKIREFLQANEIEFIDLLGEFAGFADSRSLWVASDDAHPNEKAHARIAEYSREFLEL